ncbi:MAG TPA: MFS transporter [Rhodanobacteraceae bacterium]
MSTIRDITAAPVAVNRLAAFITISIALLMMSVDSTIVATALHALQEGLGTSVNWAGWTITAYALGFVLMLPLSGKLSDWYGRRRVFLGSVVTFTVASLCCGLADNIYVLIALRALQAAGGAGFTPSATAIVVDYFGDQRDRAVSLFGSIFPVGAMIGPIFGGLFVTYWTWRGVFFVNVPIGLLVVVLAVRFVPRDPVREDRTHPRPDWTGMALLGAGIMAGMLAASYLGEAAARLYSPLFLVPAAVAVLALTLFFRHLGRSSRPFIAPRFIRGPGFVPVNLINALYGGVVSGSIALVPLYAVNRYGMDALRSGTLLIAQGIAAIVFSVIAALALRRTGHRLPLYVGGAVIAVGLVLLALAPPWGLSAYAWLAASAFLVGAGGGVINPPSRNAGLQLAPRESATLAALRSMSRQCGAITTVSVVTAVIASAYGSGTVQAWCYVACAALLVVAMPIIARVPEHHGSW